MPRVAATPQQRGGEPQHGLVLPPLSANATEDCFIWLIRLGVLRREVDGQGLTARVRAHPMGNQLLKRWPQAGRRPAPGSGCMASAGAGHGCEATHPLMVLGTSSGASKSLMTARSAACSNAVVSSRCL